MIPLETLGGLKIPVGSLFGIIPRYHKAALFLNLDHDPKQNSGKEEISGDITVHGHCMELGSCCTGTAIVDWDTMEITFDSLEASFRGRYFPEKRMIKGHVSLRGADNLECSDCPISFTEITE